MAAVTVYILRMSKTLPIVSSLGLWYLEGTSLPEFGPGSRVFDPYSCPPFLRLRWNAEGGAQNNSLS